MKKSIFVYFLIVLTIMFTSCSKEEAVEPQARMIEEIEIPVNDTVYLDSTIVHKYDFSNFVADVPVTNEMLTSYLISSSDSKELHTTFYDTINNEINYIEIKYTNGNHWEYPDSVIVFINKVKSNYSIIPINYTEIIDKNVIKWAGDSVDVNVDNINTMYLYKLKANINDNTVNLTLDKLNITLNFLYTNVNNDYFVVDFIINNNKFKTFLFDEYYYFRLTYNINTNSVPVWGKNVFKESTKICYYNNLFCGNFYFDFYFDTTPVDLTD